MEESNRSACRIIFPTSSSKPGDPPGNGASSRGFTPLYPGERDSHIRLREEACRRACAKLEDILRSTFFQCNRELCENLREYIDLSQPSPSSGAPWEARLPSRLRVVLIENCLDLPEELELGLGSAILNAPHHSHSSGGPSAAAPADVEFCLVQLRPSELRSVRSTLHQIQLQFRQRYPTSARESREQLSSSPEDVGASSDESVQSLRDWFQRYSSGKRYSSSS